MKPTNNEIYEVAQPFMRCSGDIGGEVNIIGFFLTAYRMGQEEIQKQLANGVVEQAATSDYEVNLRVSEFIRHWPLEREE